MDVRTVNEHLQNIYSQGEIFREATIRKFRLSERRFYQKIIDIYATSMDYNKEAPTTRAFFAKVQNKLHFAIHGHTASKKLLFRPIDLDGLSPIKPVCSGQIFVIPRGRQAPLL